MRRPCERAVGRLSDRSRNVFVIEQMFENIQEGQESIESTVRPTRPRADGCRGCAGDDPVARPGPYQVDELLGRWIPRPVPGGLRPGRRCSLPGLRTRTPGPRPPENRGVAGRGQNAVTPTAVLDLAASRRMAVHAIADPGLTQTSRPPGRPDRRDATEEPHEGTSDPIPVGQRQILASAVVEIEQAVSRPGAGDRYVSGHLGARRAAAAVLSRPERDRTGPELLGMWTVLPAVAPGLTEWARFLRRRDRSTDSRRSGTDPCRHRPGSRRSGPRRPDSAVVAGLLIGHGRRVGRRRGRRFRPSARGVGVFVALRRLDAGGSGAPGGGTGANDAGADRPRRTVRRGAVRPRLPGRRSRGRPGVDLAVRPIVPEGPTGTTELPRLHHRRSPARGASCVGAIICPGSCCWPGDDGDGVVVPPGVGGTSRRGSEGPGHRPGSGGRSPRRAGGLVGSRFECGRALAVRRPDVARQVLRRWQEVLGGDVRIEVVCQWRPPADRVPRPARDQRVVAAGRGPDAQFARDTGVEPVLTNAVRHAEQGQARVVDVPMRSDGSCRSTVGTWTAATARDI